MSRGSSKHEMSCESHVSLGVERARVNVCIRDCFQFIELEI